MQLLALTPAEIAYLGAPAGVPDPLCVRFTRKLAQTLTARLQMTVQAHASTVTAGVETSPGLPYWQPDGMLATLWLTRRLGGQRMTGNAAAFLPKSLLLTLDAALAECWLDAPAINPPPALAWHFETPLGAAALSLQLPVESTVMTRWAREVIQHGH